MVFGLTYNHLKSRKREYLMRLENGITRNLQLAIAGCGVSLPGWRMSSVVFQQIRECIHLNGVTALLWGLDKLWPMAFSLQIKILGAQPCLVTCVWSMAAYMAKLSDCNRDHMASKPKLLPIWPFTEENLSTSPCSRRVLLKPQCTLELHLKILIQ